MSKHRLSPTPLPQAKRLQTSVSTWICSEPSNSAFERLSDELILSIFSYFSWFDLCTTQATSKKWARLAADNHLWKVLYLRVYGRPRLRGARGFVGRTDGREVRPLPGRAKVDDIKDWKWMFRISSNWKNGRCNVEQLHSLPAHDCFMHGNHILLAGPLTILASNAESTHPVIQLHNTSALNPSLNILQCSSHHPNSRVSITALALDQSPPKCNHKLRLSAFLSSGEFGIFNVDYATPSASRRSLVYVPNRNTERTTPIIKAVYHHPLLIALSQTFQLSLYDLSNDSVRHTQTLTSFTSFPPTSFVLSTPHQSTYKLVLAYTIPVYPAHWSVGATELIIASPTNTSDNTSSLVLTSLASNLNSLTSEPMTVISSRTARALEVPQGWIDEQKLLAMREQWGRKVARVADTQTDGKWVVLAPGDEALLPLEDSELSPSASLYRRNSVSAPSSPASFSRNTYTSSLHSPTTLQLYRLHLPTSMCSSSVLTVPPTISSRPTSLPAPKLTFVRHLHGQISPIAALSVSDGRCVSLATNGSVWVWDLEAGTGAEVAAAGGVLMGREGTGTVTFDERRIITTGMNGVFVRRFDI